VPPWRQLLAGGQVTGQSIRFRVLLSLVTALLIAVVLVPVVYALTLVGHPGTRGFALPSATATPTASGTPDPQSLAWLNSLHNAAQVAYVDDLIAHMSLDEEIGQMLVTDFLGTSVDSELATKIQQYHIGSAILYGRNYYSAASLRNLSHQMQADSKIPMFIAIDQEGGTVNRLGALEGYRPSAEAMASRNDPNYVRQFGEQDGQLMASVGVNVNLAPVVDVQAVPDGQTYMSWRMFGWTPDKVAAMAGAYLAGEQENHHVVGTLKHFPGLGSISGDPHVSTVMLNRSLDDLNRIDWAPYRTLIASGQVDLIMTTHIYVPAVDPSAPTTVSYPVTTGILRNQLGFQGVIITDDIYMASLAAHYSYAQRVTQAVLAGNDLIASVFTLNATAAAEQILHDDVTSGKITKQRIDESVRRILLLKLRYGILPMPQTPPAQ
jgi:beta-N-acetylhexosaminidase